MIKSLLTPLMIPMILNLLMITILMSPSKMNKFHPMSFMIMLIFLTFMITINMNFIFNSWISFILFLTMIGGLMVIFMYITSLTNNELFYLNLKMILINIKKILFLIILMILIQNLFNEYMYFIIKTPSWLNNFIFMIDQNNMNFMYKKYYNKSTIFIMLYLYYSMICVMNICINFKMPLRQTSF